MSQDPETGYWLAESDDIPGLVSEAQTVDDLVARVMEIVPDILSPNGVGDLNVSLRFLVDRSREFVFLEACRSGIDSFTDGFLDGISSASLFAASTRRAQPEAIDTVEMAWDEVGGELRGVLNHRREAA